MKRGRVVEGRFGKGAFAPPEWLPGEARAVWERYAPLLVRAAILTDLDLSGFAILCAVSAEVERQWCKGIVPTAELLEELLCWQDAYLMTPASLAGAGKLLDPA